MKAKKRKTYDGVTGLGRPFSQRGAAWLKACSVQAIESGIKRGELPTDRQVGGNGAPGTVVLYEKHLDEWQPRKPGQPGHDKED